MRPSVSAAFFDWSSRWEGATDFLYLDVLGLVTVGIGQLVDPYPLMGGLRFTRADGSQATPSEVSQAWLATKGRQDLKMQGGGAFRYVTKIRATHNSLAAHANAKLARFETDLRATFPDWDTWPANAQLPTLGLCWAAGSHMFAKFPRLTAALRAQDWVTASRECHLNEAGNPGLAPRNKAQAALYLAAASGGCQDTLTL
jgi:GH24 family phage-related lysozyme (muramidase)